MAGSPETFKHHKYKGMHNSSLPDNYIDESNPEEVTISQLRNKYHHLRRVTDRESKPTIRERPQDEIFSDVYSEFLNFYSRGQLQHLEKLFLMADQDRDGQLNPFELKYWMERQGNPISEREVIKIFKVADENKDGYLSFREFLLFCQSIDLKNIPSDNQGKRAQGLVEDPTGQSNKYPPRYDDGVGKIASKLKSFTQIRGNIGGAVEFFENEISKETESAERNRRTYDAVMESKRAYSRPRKSIPKTEQLPQDQRYRTSLHIQLQPTNQEEPYLMQNASVDALQRRESKNSRSSNFNNRRSMSEDRGTETPRNYRTSMHFELQTRQESSLHVNPNVSPNAYNISSPFIQQPKSGSNRRSRSIGQQKHSIQNGGNRQSESSGKRNSVPIGSSKTEKHETNANRRNTFPQSDREKSLIPVSSKSDTQVVYVADPNLRTSSGPNLDKTEQQASDPIPLPPPMPPPPPPPLPPSKVQAVEYKAKKRPLVEFLLNEKIGGANNQKSNNKKQGFPEVKSVIIQTAPESESIGVQTEVEAQNENTNRKMSVLVQTIDPPILQSSGAQTTPVESVNQASSTLAIESKNENIETNMPDYTHYATPINSEFSIL